MATPFSAFRKYTGALMAVLCGLLMVSFVVADPLMQMLGGGGGGRPAWAKDTVVVWDGGSMNELELGEAVRHRLILAEFQRQVAGLGLRDAQAAGVGDVPLRVRPLALPSTPEENVEEDIVSNKIFAQRARDAGMVVSDEMIVDYLRALGRDRVSSEQMRTIMSGMQAGAGRRATIAFVFDLLREAMLATNYLSSHLYVFGTVLPEERWEDWLKVNDRVILEAAPVPAADFLNEVEEPTDEQLEAYFAEYQDREPAPDVLGEYGGVQLASPTPGFATPPRVRLHYAVGKFETFVEKTLDDVSDEEIAEYYEANKDRFIEADRTLFGDDDLFGPADDETEADNGEEEAASDPTTEPSDETATEASEVKADAAPESETEEAPANELEPETSDADATPETPVSEEATETPTAVEEEEEEEETADDAAEAETETESEADVATGVDSEADATDDKGIEYQPLEEVSEEIRRRIAENKAGIRLRELMFELKRELDDAYAGYFDAMLDATDAEAEPPEPPAALTDFSPLAEKYGLEVTTTEPTARLDLAETSPGRSINADPTSPRPLPLWFISFSEGAVDTFEPIVTFDAENNFYLSAIVERLERVTPELDDVRDEVIAAWKREKAADLAIEAAEELADEVTDSGLSIGGYLTNNPGGPAGEAFETDPFGLLSVAGVSDQTGEVFLRLSQPAPLSEPGPGMLESVFDLEAGEVGAALNHDRSVAYVLRVATRLTPVDRLRSQFLSEGGTWYGSAPLARVRGFRARSAVIGSLVDEAEVEWLREPDQPR